jgi:hypothetical protein
MLHSEAKNTLKHSLLKSSSQMLAARSGVVKQDGNTTATQQSRQMNRRTNPNKRTTNVHLKTNLPISNAKSKSKCKKQLTNQTAGTNRGKTEQYYLKN